MLAGDAGLHAWSLNRFLSFKSRAGCHRRTSRYYSAALRVFVWFTVVVSILLLVITQIFSPSVLLGFIAELHFDLAFTVMIVGTAFVLPSNLASALYRAHGQYGRIVWLQCVGTIVAQLGQLIALMATGSLLAVVIAYVICQIVTMSYILLVDVGRQFPFLDNSRAVITWRWTAAQFKGAAPFAIMNFTEVGLTYLSVLLIGALVSDRIAVAQWALTRTIAALLRGLCLQVTLPLAAELGHDHAIGAYDTLRQLYARGSVFLAIFAGFITAGALVFWPDFFKIWTHGSIPYDSVLTWTLLLGSCIAAPAILALSYANYSNRGYLLLWTKSLQLSIFLLLSIILISTVRSAWRCARPRHQRCSRPGMYFGVKDCLGNAQAPIALFRTYRRIPCGDCVRWIGCRCGSSVFSIERRDRVSCFGSHALAHRHGCSRCTFGKR